MRKKILIRIMLMFVIIGCVSVNTISAFASETTVVSENASIDFWESGVESDFYATQGFTCDGATSATMIVNIGRIDDTSEKNVTIKVFKTGYTPVLNTTYVMDSGSAVYHFDIKEAGYYNVQIWGLGEYSYAIRIYNS